MLRCQNVLPIFAQICAPLDLTSQFQATQQEKAAQPGLLGESCENRPTSRMFGEGNLFSRERQLTGATPYLITLGSLNPDQNSVGSC